MKNLFFLSFSKLWPTFHYRRSGIHELKRHKTLWATLTVPAKVNYASVAISGQTDRDETIFKHKFFKDLAEYLSSNGITVVRYDDRGCFKSTEEMLRAAQHMNSPQMQK